MIFCFSFLIVVLTALFFEKRYLIYAKPLIPISLMLIYLVSNTKSLRLYFVLSMITIMINDSFVYYDFVRYFDLVAVIIILFYSICIIMLSHYVNFQDVKSRNFFSIPIVVSIILISYLIFSISNLVLPNLIDSVISFFLVLIAIICFVGTCFFIYIIDKFYGNFRLFITASCCLFVNGLLLINDFYYYSRVFTVLINIAETLGLYFFMKFFIEAKPIEAMSEKNGYL